MLSTIPAVSNPAPHELFHQTSGPFRENLDIDSFAFSHNLEGHPLFELPRLAELSKKVIAANTGNLNHHVICKIAESVPNIARQWENFLPVERVHETIRHIEESGSWILITGAQVDADYQKLLDDLIAELEQACKTPLKSEIMWSCLSILVGSPNSVTHYHMDSETNFLFQIHGSKEAHLFDQRDRSILSEEEIEIFNAVDGKHIKFRDDFSAKERVFNLTPGTGIHIPVNAPHWVRNLNEYSVTLSILFYRKDMTRRAWVYQTNHLIRKLGMTPTPPGRLQFIDRVKCGIIGALSRRSPRDKHDILKSGYRRLAKPLKVARILR